MKKSFKKDRKYKKKKRQALKAILDDFSESSDDDTDEEIVNLCFMALEEPSSDEVTLDFESNDEILLDCENWCINMINTCLELIHSKKW